MLCTFMNSKHSHFEIIFTIETLRKKAITHNLSLSRVDQQHFIVFFLPSLCEVCMFGLLLNDWDQIVYVLNLYYFSVSFCI